MSSKKVSLRKIAQACDCSHSTVSMALRNDPRIPNETRNKIQRTAQKMGYRGDPVVGQLMSRIRSKNKPSYLGTLAWLNSWDSAEGSPWFTQKMHFNGAYKRAKALGYHLESFWFAEPGLTSKRASQILKTKGIEGVIISELPDQKNEVDLEWSSFACASIGYSLNTPVLHRSANAYFEDLRKALHYLKEKKYQQPGLLLTFDMDTRVGFNWSGAFLSYNKMYYPQKKLPLLFKKEITNQDFKRWFKKYRPDAIISNQYPIHEWLKSILPKTQKTPKLIRMDVRSPENPIQNKTWKGPKNISGICQHPDIVGASAVDLVVTQLNCHEKGIPKYPQLLLVQGSWVQGN